MDIKNLAALAVEADDKQKELETEIKRQRTADIAVKAVLNELGLQGEAVKVTLRPYGWGNLTVVEVADKETSLTITVHHTATDGPDRGLYGPVPWKFTVTHINGTDLTGPDARYRSAPGKVTANVRFLAGKPNLNEVRSLADVGRLLAAWEAFQAQKVQAERVSG